MNSFRLQVTLTAIAAFGVLTACAEERPLEPRPAEPRVFVDLWTGEFGGIVALDPTTWEVVDSTSRYGLMELLGASQDKKYIFGRGWNKLFKIDAHTLVVTDSLVVATLNSNFLLIPEDGIILRATKAMNAVEDTLDIIQTASLSIRESRVRSCFVRSWNPVARVVVGTNKYPWGDTVVLYDYEKDSVLQSCALRRSNSQGMLAYRAILDHTRGRILAQWRHSFLAFDLLGDSIIFTKSLQGDGFGNIVFTSDMDHFFVSDPGNFEWSGGNVYKFNADTYELEASIKTWYSSLNPDDWIEPGQMVLSQSEDELYLVPTGLREGPITVLDAHSLAFLHGVRLWDWPDQRIRSIVLIE